MAEKSGETDTDEWQWSGPYDFIHPAGWTITNSMVNGKSVWILRPATYERGNYKSADEAKRRHAELSRQASKIVCGTGK